VEAKQLVRGLWYFQNSKLESLWWLLINCLSKIVLFIILKSQIMMASPLEICELVEQLTWPYRISTCLVHSRKSYVVRNLMAMTASKKMW